MYPYLNIGPLHLGTFGLLLWLAAVVATYVLHRNFARQGVDADALEVVVFVVIAGVIGAKLWHELQDVSDLRASLRQIALPGARHPFEIAAGFLQWFKAGFAWFGGLLAGIAVLLYSGARTRPNGLSGAAGAVRMLDLAAPAAAIGYGVGRIGCLTSGDGDYGIKTTLPWGVRMKPNALFPPNPPDALVQPTPVYELLFSLLVCAILWRLGVPRRALGWLTGLYLVLTGTGRFFVEFVRINPRLYWGMSNAQVAALGSVVVGWIILLVTSRKRAIVANEVRAV